MARIPDGGTLIKNSASVAPGFQIGNVFVMAGVPMVMRAMMEEILPRLPRGAPVLSITISAALPEGTIAQGLADIQKAYPADRHRLLSMVSRRHIRRAAGGALARRGHGGGRRQGYRSHGREAWRNSRARLNFSRLSHISIGPALTGRASCPHDAARCRHPACRTAAEPLPSRIGTRVTIMSAIKPARRKDWMSLPPST